MDIYALAMLAKIEGVEAVRAALDKLRGKLGDTEKGARAFDGALSMVGGELKALAAGFGVVAVMGKIATETSEAEFAQAQLAAALRSTANVAGQTQEALNEHAAALAEVSVFDDDVISGAQALLLTFTQIRGPIFQDATQAILNVAQAMGTDLRSATIQVGKALNDPILGVTALSRAGIQFTDAQKDMIKQLVESNRLLDAQKIILAELETQFGSSAEAARNTFGGALKGLANDLGNAMTLTGDSANIATRAINAIAEAIRDARRELDIQYAGFKSFYTNVTGFFRILKAMELGPGYAAEYYKITAEMRAARAEFDRLASGADQLRPPTQKAADFMQKFSGSALSGASAFGLMSDSIFKAGATLRSFATETKGTAPTGETIDWKARASEFDKWFADYQEKQRQVARDAMAARNIASLTRVAAQPPALVTEIGAGAAGDMRASVRASMSVTREIVDDELATSMAEVQQTFASGFGAALGQGIAAGFEVAFASKSIGQGFKALTGTILSSFGSMLVQFGTKALIASKQIQNLFQNLFTPGPMSAFAAAAIIAIGAGLMAAGRGITGGAAGGGAGGFQTATGGMGTGAFTLPGVTFGPTMARSASDISPAKNLTFNIIGVNDPSAQRQIQELVRNADRRGNTTTV